MKHLFMIPLLLATLLLTACSFNPVGEDLAEVSPETAQGCAELGVSLECNTKLYADQVAAMGEGLLEMLSKNQISQASYNVQAELVEQARQAVNNYATGGGDLAQTSNNLRQLAAFISDNGGAFRIIDGMRTIFDAL